MPAPSITKAQASTNKEYEKSYFDRTFQLDVREPTSRFYSVVDGCRDFYEGYLLSVCCGKKVLEYGCGKGSSAFFLAENGASTVGIDISEVGISFAREQAAKRNLHDIDFLAMDAEATEFEDSTYDIVCGTGILHHLRTVPALKELTRIIKPEGEAVFIEPLGHNPAINLYRKLTPRFRTKDEHPLVKEDFQSMEAYFGETRYVFFNLLALLSVPFRNMRGFPSLVKALAGLDKRLFARVPALGLFAWQVIIILKNPRKGLVESPQDQGLK